LWNSTRQSRQLQEPSGGEESGGERQYMWYPRSQSSQKSNWSCWNNSESYSGICHSKPPTYIKYNKITIMMSWDTRLVISIKLLIIFFSWHVHTFTFHLPLPNQIHFNIDLLRKKNSLTERQKKQTVQNLSKEDVPTWCKQFYYDIISYMASTCFGHLHVHLQEFLYIGCSEFVYWMHILVHF